MLGNKVDQATGVQVNMAPVVKEEEREQVTFEPSSGTVIAWRGKFGWIQPSTPIDHPEAKKRGGKIYVAQEDLTDGSGKLARGTTVRFCVYSDNSGLGAMDCQVDESEVPAPKQQISAAKKPFKATAKSPAKGSIAKALPYSGKASGQGVIKTAAKVPYQGKAATNGGNGVVKDSPAARAAASRYYKAVPAKAQVKPAKGAAAGRGSVASLLSEQKGNTPDKASRTRVLAKRVHGEVAKWRGKMGWIKPNEEIDHPEAEKHRRQIYIHEVDVQPGHRLFVGAQVNFFVYVDDDGLGAEHCMLSQEQSASAIRRVMLSDKKPQTLQPKAKTKAKGGGKAKEGAQPKLTMVQKTVLKLRQQKGKAQGAQQKKEKKSGPDLPRARVTASPMSGEVAAWKGKFGWIVAAEEIDHEQASKNQGKIYVHIKDVLEGTPLEVGQQVEFHVYADDSGLGAEECMVTA